MEIKTTRIIYHEYDELLNRTPFEAIQVLKKGADFSAKKWVSLNSLESWANDKKALIGVKLLIRELKK